MPEIAEVEYARRQCHHYCLGRTITALEAQPDALVFSGVTSDEFIASVQGKTVVDTKRWGKYFVLILDREPHIVAHFGMTGTLKFQHDKGVLQLEHEKYVPNDSWPPRFCKALFTLHDPKNTTADPILMAFSDPRRLGRLRLVEGDPLQQMPISKLGFDPLMNLPDKMTFAGLVQKRAVPIKSLLLDQGFSAGVGNWVADEILYHARIHPAHYSHALTLEQCYTIREEMERVCRVAVEAEADSSLYPEDWLMTYRWNKGKGKVSLPNGHALAFVTVGGRTSCYAPTLQPLSKSNAPAPSAKSTKTKKRSLHDSDTAKEDAVPRRTVLSRAERYALRVSPRLD